MNECLRVFWDGVIYERRGNMGGVGFKWKEWDNIHSNGYWMNKLNVGRVWMLLW